jgi:hypothetical protein
VCEEEYNTKKIDPKYQGRGRGICSAVLELISRDGLTYTHPPTGTLGAIHTTHATYTTAHPQSKYPMTSFQHRMHCLRPPFLTAAATISPLTLITSGLDGKKRRGIFFFSFFFVQVKHKRKTRGAAFCRNIPAGISPFPLYN